MLPGRRRRRSSWFLVIAIVVSVLEFADAPAAATARTVSGRTLAGDTGAPLAGITLRAYPTYESWLVHPTNAVDATTDATGRYTMTLLAEGAYDLYAYAWSVPYFDPPSIRIAAGATNLTQLDLRLERAYFITVQIDRSDSAKPGRTWLQLFASGSRGCCVPFDRPTFAAGPVTGIKVRPGAYRLYVRSEDPGYHGSRVWYPSGMNFDGAKDIVIGGDPAVSTAIKVRLDPTELDPPAPASAVALMQLHNDLRAWIGLPPIERDPALESAAGAHARYVAQYGSGHFEDPSRPEFTARTPQERAAKFGFGGLTVSEVAITYGQRDLRGVATLFGLPYHRLGMMHPHAVVGGWGLYQDSVRSGTVGDFGYYWSNDAPDLVVTPPPGATGIPATFYGGFEAPVACFEGGYPIMLMASYGRSVQLRAAAILNLTSGKGLSFSVAQQLYEPDYVTLCPQAYEPGSTYRVRIDLTVAGVPLSKQWEFSVSPDGRETIPSYHARWFDQSGYAVLGPGEERTLQVRYRNLGIGTWERGVAGREVRLGIVGDNPRFATLGIASGWLNDVRPAAQVEQFVEYGDLGTFRFTVRAPNAPGIYDIPLRPLVEGWRWLEDDGVFLRISVAGAYRAKWVSGDLSRTLDRGTETQVSVSVTNTGTTAWIKGQASEARLGIFADDATFASTGMAAGWPFPTRAAVQSEMTVPPGSDATFTFAVRAVNAGSYVLRVLPVIDGSTWMEEAPRSITFVVR